MPDIILHHYAISPYSEKVRAMLGFKGLSWKSVQQPMVMPKPDQLALTGGYRRAPVLQIGRDVYCDSRLIARVLDRLQPQPPLVPAAHKASCAAFAQLESTLFFTAIATALQPAGLKAMAERLGPQALDAFFKDRALIFTGATPRPTAEYGRLNFLPLMSALDSQLADRPFLLGGDATLADFIVHHAVWFVHGNPGVAYQLDAFKNLLAWEERIRGLGQGQATELSPADALSIAREAREYQPFDGPLLEPEGIKAGQRVRVQATDYACEPAEGTLLHASVFELVLQRTDERAGEVRVHFPRSDFKVAA